MKKIKSRIRVLHKHVGNNFFVYNGRRYEEVFVTTDIVGYRFGEFIFTRKYNKKK